MLLALIGDRPGLPRAAALALLSLSLLFAVTLFGGQFASQEKFGCTHFGEDFAILYASSQLVLLGEGASVYEPSELARVQAHVLAEADSICQFNSVMAYWLGFLLPFFPLTALTPKLAYYLWTGITIGLFLFALWRLATAANVSPWPFVLIAFAFFPVISGLLQGQVHGWQFLALTEFWLAFRRRSDRVAGLWLSLLLVKPQFLPLLLLYLLWQRRWQTLMWFTGAGAIWLGLTIFLANGSEGVGAYLRMMRNDVAAADAPIGVPNMVNWRAFSLIWFGAAGSAFVFVLTVLLSITTVLVTLWAWQRRSDISAARLNPQSLLLLMAATLLIGYDTHAYSAVLVFGPAVLLLAEMGMKPGSFSRFWSFVLDFTLLGSAMATIAFLFLLPNQVIHLPGIFLVTPLFVSAQAMIAGLVTIVLGGAFLSSSGTRYGAAVAEGTFTGRKVQHQATTLT